MAGKLVYGVGINDADYVTQKKITVNGKQIEVWACPFYKKWQGMLRRCYDPQEHAKHPSYLGCSVCDEWLSFSAFKAWMERQDWQGKHLDKDILVNGNKLYSPATCVFVSESVNKFLTEQKRNAGSLPLGVSLVADTKKYRAQCCNLRGVRIHLGCYSTPAEAHQAWLRKKHELACQLAAEQSDRRIAAALSTRFQPLKECA